MKRALGGNFCLQVQIHVGGFLLAGDRLDRVQALLRERAPQWAEGLYLFRSPRDRRPIDVEAAGALGDRVRVAANERGPLYARLAREFGDPAPRVLGSAELRGRDSSLVVVVMLDEMAIWPCGEAWLWGNNVGLSVCRRKIEGVSAATWSGAVTEAMCAALSPPHAYAHLQGEYDAKNMSHEGGGLRAIGVDVSKALPGLYWLNFFGQPYRDLIGRQRLLAAPAHEVREVDDGVLLMLHPDPEAWDAPEYREAEQRVLDHLGREHFFDRDHPDRRTMAPAFDLPPRPDPPLQHTITVDLAETTAEPEKPHRRWPFGRRE